MTRTRTIPTTRTPSVVSSSIRIEGEEIARTFSVYSIVVSKEINKVPRAKVIILDGSASGGNFGASNEELFIPGKEMEILSGYQNDLQTIFKGIIISHSIKIRPDGSSALIVECRDKAFKMTLSRQSRYFFNQNDSEIIQQKCREYGMNADTASSPVAHKEVVQYNSTDWDFIISRAEANGLFCIVNNGGLSVHPPDLQQDPALSLQYGATILELDAEIDARNQVSGITSQSWSYEDQRVEETDARDPALSLNGNLSPEFLAEVSGREKHILRHGGRLSTEELQAWSDAMLLRRQLAKVRGRVKCRGIHNVNPGETIELGGIGERFNGKAWVSGIQHQIADGGWQMDIQFGIDPETFAEKVPMESPPASGLLPAIKGLHAGVVTELGGDPDDEDRIQVRLPLIDQANNGIWARVASLDAGNERGAFFRPEIGDEVIVGFINDDPRDAIVLGMLNSSNKPAPLPTSNDNHQKGFVSRSKLKWIFDDEKRSITAETPDGKKIVASDHDGTVEISDENNNSIVMDSQGITIKSDGKIEIKAQRDLNLEGMMSTNIKAGTSFKAEGSAGAEISSSGVVEINGSLVKIN